MKYRIYEISPFLLKWIDIHNGEIDYSSVLDAENAMLQRLLWLEQNNLPLPDCTRIESNDHNVIITYDWRKY